MKGLSRKLYLIEKKQHTTPPTMTTLIEVREVRDATLVAMATIRSSWVMRAVSLFCGAIAQLGPEEGVGASSAGRAV